MTPSDATAEVFMTAFSQLPKAARESFLIRLISDRTLKDDLIDIAVAEKRSKEKTRSFQKAAADMLKKRTK